MFVVFGLFAFYASIGTFATTATFSFWISEQGGEQLALSTSVGLMWIVAGLAPASPAWPSSSAAHDSHGAGPCCS